MAAAAAQRWWAVFGGHARRPAAPAAADTTTGTILRLAASAPLLLAGAMLLCAAIGFAITQVSENRVEVDQHAALQRALDEFHAVAGDMDAPDDIQLRRIARSAGLGDLRFDANPTGESGREIQSLHDARGRIVGWFSWTAGGTLVGAMDRMWGLLAAIAIVLAACGYLALRAAQRLVDALDQSAEAVRRLASNDVLTGLPNHRAMLQSLSDAVGNRRSGIVAFALIDLDGFREVNETLGRAGGDAVLKNVAEHLQAGLPVGALLGRFEEDQFAAVLSGEKAQTAGALGEALRAALLRPIFADRMWQITGSIGIAQAPEDGATGDEVARRAGLALLAAKREGRGRTTAFAPQIETDYAERRFLLHELQSAIALQAFDVHYQPVVSAEGSAIVAVEALLRWTHPSRGAIPPSVFIPLAEQSGLMSQLGEIVLRRALSDGARWQSLSVAVNLSPVQMRDRWLVDLVDGIMADTGMPPSRVILELTEGILIDNPQNALQQVEALRALGVRIALDDFGSGYSSLSYLQKFPFDQLKIDRAFVASLGQLGSVGAIIQSIVTLGHALGMKVVAEGVENDEQRVLLRLAGCDEMQGYLFGKPVPSAEIDKMLAGPARAASA